MEAPTDHACGDSFRATEGMGASGERPSIKAVFLRASSTPTSVIICMSDAGAVWNSFTLNERERESEREREKSVQSLRTHLVQQVVGQLLVQLNVGKDAAAHDNLHPLLQLQHEGSELLRHHQPQHGQEGARGLH
jgi:hypothetical protein